MARKVGTGISRVRTVSLWHRVDDMSGAIVPITLGQMRNSFLPKRFAVYLTEAQREELKEKNIVPERDYTFRVEDKRKRREEAAKKAALPAPAPVKEPAPAPKPKPVELEMLTVRSPHSTICLFFCHGAWSTDIPPAGTLNGAYRDPCT